MDDTNMDNYMGVEFTEDFKVIRIGHTDFDEEALVLIIKENGKPVLMEEQMCLAMFGHGRVANNLIAFKKEEN